MERLSDGNIIPPSSSSTRENYNRLTLAQLLGIPKALDVLERRALNPTRPFFNRLPTPVNRSQNEEEERKEDSFCTSSLERYSEEGDLAEKYPSEQGQNNDPFQPSRGREVASDSELNPYARQEQPANQNPEGEVQGNGSSWCGRLENDNGQNTRCSCNLI